MAPAQLVHVGFEAPDTRQRPLVFVVAVVSTPVPLVPYTIVAALANVFKSSLGKNNSRLEK